MSIIFLMIKTNIIVNKMSHLENNTSFKAHHYLRPRLEQHTGSTFTPLQLAQIYNFPTGLTGAGQKIGIIELDGSWSMSDITAYMQFLGIHATPNITNVFVDGASLHSSDADLEVILDIEIICAIAPAAEIRVYFAPNTLQGFYDAFLHAYNDRCTLISCSWGAPEDAFGSSNITNYNNLFSTIVNGGTTILVASGDKGSSDVGSGNNCDFPSSSVYSLACGGTRLTASGNTRISEVVWNDNPTSSASGGGISKYLTKGSYQSNINISNMRLSPEFSGNADPQSAYVVIMNGSTTNVGGTSAVAPLYTGLLALVNQSLGRAVGFLHPVLYAHTSMFFDVVSGNNGYYVSSVGYDNCSGLGVINGQALLSVLQNNNPPPTPTAAFTFNPTGGVAPLTVQFTNQSTNASSYSWQFGNGQNATSQNPSTTYQTAGTYQVTLTASNNTGSSSVTHSIVV